MPRPLLVHCWGWELSIWLLALAPVKATRISCCTLIYNLNVEFYNLLVKVLQGVVETSVAGRFLLVRGGNHVWQVVTVETVPLAGGVPVCLLLPLHCIDSPPPLPSIVFCWLPVGPRGPHWFRQRLNKTIMASPSVSGNWDWSMSIMRLMPVFEVCLPVSNCHNGSSFLFW